MAEIETEAKTADTPASDGDKRVIQGVGSVVTLDYATGLVHKSYKPRFAVRALYWLAFQAPFPYSNDRDALEASRERRVVVGLLTKFWFGLDIVAPVVGVEEDAAGNTAFVTELVRGHEPENKYRARRFLKLLTQHFIEAGLPTWQVSPHNPRSVGNLMEVEDGTYRIIDLESNLVAALTPMSAVTSAIRQKNFPNFDDIDTATLEAYLAKHGRRIREKLGGEDYLKLMDAAIAYAEYVKRWHSREPRLVGKVLRVAFLPVNTVSGWRRGIERLIASGQLRAEIFIRRGIMTWLREGRITQPEAQDLRRSLREPEVSEAIRQLGIQLAFAIPLRFPLGSIQRFVWTVFHRIKAEVGGLIKRKAPHAERQLHTLMIALLGAVPGFGAGAYLLSKPLRSNPGLAAVGFDRVMRKVPFKVYHRLNLGRISKRIYARGKPREA